MIDISHMGFPQPFIPTQDNTKEMNRISTENEMRVFQAKMIAGMYDSLDEFAERVNGHNDSDLDEYHKAFRNLSRQLKVWQDGILESHRELFHELYRGDEAE